MSRSLLAGAAALSLIASSAASSIVYNTVGGFFLQDLNTTVASTFNYTATNFGLINQTYDTDAAFDPAGNKTQWQRFENKVKSLQAAANSSTNYKVLYIGRHGEGFHNIAETFYGTPAWNCFWAEQDGNGTISWADARITPNGAAQAQLANTFWASQIAVQKQSIPQSFYSSPLTRCLQTAQITWANLTDIKPTVKELFREGISQHNCDRRSTKTYIQQNYPGWPIEEGFTEFDQLWEGIAFETSDGEDIRSKTVLDDVFSSDKSMFISITTHSGEGASLLRVLNHITFGLGTGAVIPVLVEAVTVDSTPASSSIPFLEGATCLAPPISSISTLSNGCVCTTGTSSFTVIAAAVTTPTVPISTTVLSTTKVLTVLSCDATVTDCPTNSVITISTTQPIITSTSTETGSGSVTAGGKPSGTSSANPSSTSSTGSAATVGINFSILVGAIIFAILL